MMSVVADGCSNYSGGRSLVSGIMQFPSQSRSLAFTPISQIRNHSSLCSKLDVEKLAIRSVTALPPHGKAIRRFTSFVVKSTTDNDVVDVDNDINNNNRVLLDFFNHHPNLYEGMVFNNKYRVLLDIFKHHPNMYGAAVSYAVKNKVGDLRPRSKEFLTRIIDQIEKDNGKTSREDLMYRFVVDMFAKKGISMVPDLDHIMKPSTPIDIWVNWISGMHSRQAFEMILTHIHECGHQFTMGDDPISKTIKIKLLRELYAHSVVYGYYLRNVEDKYWPSCGLPVGDEYKIDLTNLMSYVASMVSYATASKDHVILLRSIGGQSMPASTISTIEKRTQEIFRYHNNNNNGIEEDKDTTMISITITGIYVLILDAVIFGIFLLQATRYLDGLDELS